MANDEIKLGSGIYKTMNDNPEYFGSFLNMARLNIYMINNFIAQYFKRPLLNEEGEIKNSFLCDSKIKKLNWNHVYAKTKRFMPIIKVFDSEELPKSESELNANIDGKDFKKMSDSLKLVFGELQEFRNDYSHYYSLTNKTKRKTTVSVEMASFLRVNLLRAIEYTKIRFKDVFSEDDFDIVKNIELVNHENEITIYGISFLISMFLERENAFLFIGKIKGLKGTHYKNFVATREVLMAYCIKLPNEKFVSENNKQAFTLDIINTLNRCPKELYQVINNEAKKEFQPQLNEEALSNLFNNSAKERNTDNINDYESYTEELTKKIRHRNRFANFALSYIDMESVFKELRFQISIGKLQTNNYPKILAGEEYERSIIDDVKGFGKLAEFSDREEILKLIDPKEICEDFVQYAPHYHTDNNKIGLYKLKQNNKALTRLINKNKPESKVKNSLLQIKPTAFLSLKELPKIILLEHLEPGKAEELINRFIEINKEKLLNREFIEEIKTKLPNDWNEFQKNTDSKKHQAYRNDTLEYLISRKDVLNNLLIEYGLNIKQIPTKILNYWLNISDVKKDRQLSDRIKLMVRKDRFRLKTYQKFKESGKGKIPKIGEMATFLAKDIVNMIISPQKKEKITSFYYVKLQECLALYADKNKRLLFYEIINNELKLNENDGHPFLKNIQIESINYTQDLYEEYLKEKVKKMIPKKNYRSGKITNIDKSWVTKTFYTLKWNEKANKKLTSVDMPNDLSNIPYSLRQLKEKGIPELDKWLENNRAHDGNKTKNKPIDLPINLFDERLIGLLQNDLQKKNIDFNSHAKFNELFKLWWQANDNDVQSFYHSEREYLINDERINFIIKNEGKFEDFYQQNLINVFNKKQEERKLQKKKDRRLPDIQFSQVEKQFKRKVSNTEKIIRIIQEEDRILFLMLGDMLNLNQNHSTNGNTKLSEIHTLLNETIIIRQAVTGKLQFNNTGEHLVRHISKTIIDERKRKDFTVLRKYIYDRRLPELFEYFSDNEIPLQLIKSELDTYNDAKAQIFELAFKLEESIINTNQNTEEIYESVIPQINGNHIPHKSYLQWLINNKMITDKELLFLSIIRNSFSHNLFPKKDIMQLFISQFNDKHLALQIYHVYHQKITNIIEQL